MSNFKSQIDLNKLPQHVAIIMDGNGRWAKQNGQPRIFGHRNGVKAVREVSEGAAELGVRYLTLYAFSTENWGRPKLEVDALMTLLVKTLREEVNTLQTNNIRLRAIGNVAHLPDRCYTELLEAIDQTKHNTRMDLVLALNYSAKWEMMEAIKKIAQDVQNQRVVPSELTEQHLELYLATAGMPNPELLIRTSGEQRLSNFLLWQSAYSELYFTPMFWPDFRREHLYEAIYDYQHRERRFGKISEQVSPTR